VERCKGYLGRVPQPKRESGKLIEKAETLRFQIPKATDKVLGPLRAGTEIIFRTKNVVGRPAKIIFRTRNAAGHPVLQEAHRGRGNPQISSSEGC